MSLLNIGIFLVFALLLTTLARLCKQTAWRNPLLLVSSILAIFWLQPALPIRGLDFWLPTATLVLVLVGWLLTRLEREVHRREDLVTTAVLVATVLLVALTRHLSITGILTPSRPPQTWQVLLVLGLFFLLVLFVLMRRSTSTRSTTWQLGLFFLLLLTVFIFLKLPALGRFTSTLLRGWSGQDTAAAFALDLRWLGFSYVAFRLIHTLRDRATGRLPDVSLQEYLIYIIFFPAFTAGPIDRVDRFIKDLRTPWIPAAEGILYSGKRLVLGLFKKFAVADALALISLNALNASQVSSPGWMWLLLYAYAFQILFDFSGYTDIAIGLGGLVGIHLPENFNNPYLRPNLTLFWNNWHITLTQWFRAYFFNPVTRWLRSAPRSLPVWLVILLTQFATMLLIGLWHGITLNFILWGAWHGVGLFIHNRWSERAKPFWGRLESRPVLHKVLTILSVLLTFHYVALGWVWFALPSISSSLVVFSVLFGGGV